MILAWCMLACDGIYAEMKATCTVIWFSSSVSLFHHPSHWIFWCTTFCLPDSLGSTNYSFTLWAFFCLRAWFTAPHACSWKNFLKPAAPIIIQMFNFFNLGFEGYKKIMYKDLHNSHMLLHALDSKVDDIHRQQGHVPWPLVTPPIKYIRKLILNTSLSRLMNEIEESIQ